MTPADQHALREALARVINPYAFHYSTPDNFGPDLEMAYFGALQRVALKTADDLIAGPLAPYLAAEAENARLKETVEAARAALKPFAEAADAYPISPVALREGRRHHEVIWSYGSEDNGNRREIAVSDIRAARSVLATIPPKENPDA